MSIYKQYVVTLFIDIFAVSFGRLSLSVNQRRRDRATAALAVASSASRALHKIRRNETNRKNPIELFIISLYGENDGDYQQRST